MAEKQAKKKTSIRDKAETSKTRGEKPQLIRGSLKKATRPVKQASKVAKKEYYLPMPDNKPGRFLNKKRSIVPKYFRESWKELKNVAWPDRKQTVKLTFAVFIFSIFFGLIIAVVDYGLDKLFKEVLL